MVTKLAAKAIWINAGNINQLKAQFEIEDVTEPLEVGYFLVKDFSQYPQPYILLTRENLNKNFTIIGKLENGFIEVERIGDV